MFARRDALLVDMEKRLLLENIVGKLRLFKDKELLNILEFFENLKEKSVKI